MRSVAISIALVLGIGQIGQAQSPSAPQTARQALLEMFLGQTPGAFEKHLPAATLAFMKQAGAGSPLQEVAGFATKIQTQTQKLETFDTGNTLLIAEDRQTRGKVEVTVDKDDLRGDEEEFQLSFRATHMNKADPMPFVPTVTLLMKSEQGIWKLNEASLTLRMPIGDPEFLKSLSSQFAGSRMAANEASAVSALRTLANAEVSYAAVYPNVGFTCSLNDLGGAGKGAPNPHGAQLIDDRLASGSKDGYVFAITGCTGSPANAFRMVAAPAAPSAGRRAFCMDESEVLRSSEDGRANTCLSSGTPMQTGVLVAPSPQDCPGCK